MNAADLVPLACPSCRCPLGEADGDGIVCAGCGREWDVVAGLVDLRLSTNGLDVDADRALALELAAMADRLDFGDLLRRYWHAQHGVAPDLVERFVGGDLVGAERAEAVMAQIEEMVGPTAARGIVLELGCGTAALASVAARRARTVVATDISLAWLVLAKVRLRAAGIENVRLVACAAEHLPFADDTFALIAAADVIEHVGSPSRVIADAYRVLRVGGAFWLSTPNRFSLTPEPHVRLWGVGWLPRPMGIAYVRWRRHVDYTSIHNFSARHLRRLLGATSGEVTLTLPAIVGPVRAGYRPAAARGIDVYNRLRRMPATRRVISTVAPLFHAVVRKNPVGV